MRLTKTEFRIGRIAAVLLAFLIMGSCGTAIRYSYDARAIFPELKSYQWAKSSIIYRQDFTAGGQRPTIDGSAPGAEGID